MKPTLEVKQYDAYLSTNNKSTFTYIDVVKVDEPDEQEAEAVLEIAYDRERQTLMVRSMDPNYELEVHVELLPEPALVIYDYSYDTLGPIFKKPLKEL